MAYNLQIPNTERIKHKSWQDKKVLRYLDKHNRFSTMKHMGLSERQSMYEYTEKIGLINPSLCFQSDVFYPNALAAVSATTTSFQDDTMEGRFVMGCVGNRFQQDFPLDARVPTALPLVQYPTQTSDILIEHADICAMPVLNWEKYIRQIRHIMLTQNVTRRSHSSTKKLKTVSDTATKSSTNEEDFAEKSTDAEDEYLSGHSSATNSDNDAEVETDTTDNDSSDEDDSESESNQLATNRKIGNVHKSKFLKQHNTKSTSSEYNQPNFAQIKSTLFKEEVDLVATNSKIKTQSKKSIANAFKENKKNFNSLYRPRSRKLQEVKNKNAPVKLIPSQLTKLKKVPDFKLQSTWNYVFGGANGSCYAEKSKDRQLTVFLGHKNLLRKVNLIKSNPASILSYKVESICDEDINIPSKPLVEERVNPLNNTICQITPAGKFNILGVRRGKSIDLYNIEENSPYLLESIPNTFYGTKNYKDKKSSNNTILDPLILGLDFNPQYSPEFISVDENKQIRVCDFTTGTIVDTYSQSKLKRNTSTLPDYPCFQSINDASGVSFGHHGQTFFSWTNSKVTFGDRRDPSFSRSTLSDIFDLRKSVSSLSWSDQLYFSDNEIQLHEFISSLLRSKKENYYYVGTTSRIFMMDVRVPGQPVLKIQHGLPSAASYLDTYMNGSFEVIIAASQRVTSTFCAITDHGHVNCYDRPGCRGVNPLLHSLPRHLSNSRDFFETACTEGYGFSWELDHERAKCHNNAWTTGLAVMGGREKDPRSPPGILVLTSNYYGDLFCQEWDQKPIELTRKTQSKDVKFSEFLVRWKDFMKSKSNTELFKPSVSTFAPVDCSLLLETSSRNISRMTKVRMQEFDATRPSELHYKYVCETQKPFAEKLQEMRKYKTEIAERCLDVWEHVSDAEEETAIKQEPYDEVYENRVGEDGRQDIELIVHDTTKQQNRVQIEDNIDGEVLNDSMNLSVKRIEGLHFEQKSQENENESKSSSISTEESESSESESDLDFETNNTNVDQVEKESDNDVPTDFRPTFPDESSKKTLDDDRHDSDGDGWGFFEDSQSVRSATELQTDDFLPLENPNSFLPRNDDEYTYLSQSHTVFGQEENDDYIPTPSQSQSRRSQSQSKSNYGF